MSSVPSEIPSPVGGEGYPPPSPRWVQPAGSMDLYFAPRVRRPGVNASSPALASTISGKRPRYQRMSARSTGESPWFDVGHFPSRQYGPEQQIVVRQAITERSRSQRKLATQYKKREKSLRKLLFLLSIRSRFRIQRTFALWRQNGRDFCNRGAYRSTIPMRKATVEVTPRQGEVECWKSRFAIATTIVPRWSRS